MKALLCKRYGGPDDLAVEDIAEPVAGPGEAIVDVKAAALNFFDTLIIAGKYQTKPAMPFSPAAEFAGVVKASAPESTASKPATVCLAISVMARRASVSSSRPIG